MRKLHLLCLLLCCFATLGLSAQNHEENLLLGTYMTEANKGKVVIAKNKAGKFVGTLVWTKTPGKLDSENPDPTQRTKKLAGKQILRGFTYSGNQVWEGGTIYDPEKGKTYSCKITRLPNGNLKVRGFIGISLLGRNTAWTRVKS